MCKLKITLLYNLYLYFKVLYYFISNLNAARNQSTQPSLREPQVARSQLHSDNVAYNVTCFGLRLR